MSNPFIGEIVMFGSNFAPRSWAFCNGQLLPIAQNTALFSILGTTYGGDGRTTMGLPNLQGRFPVHPGRGPGLTTRTLGQSSGSESVTLNTNTMAAHSHIVSQPQNIPPAQQASTSAGTQSSPIGRYPASSGEEDLYSEEISGSFGLTPVTLSNVNTSSAGSPAPQAIPNRQPSLAVNFIICLFGTFPSRS